MGSGLFLFIFYFDFKTFKMFFNIFICVCTNVLQGAHRDNF